MLICFFKSFPAAMSLQILVSFFVPLLILPVALLWTWLMWLFAKRSERTVPFWQCVGAWALLLVNPYLGLFSKYSILYSYQVYSVSGRRWHPFSSGYRWWMRDAEHIVIYSFLLGLIFLFVFSGLRRGHWLTRLFAFLLMVFLASELYVVNTGPWVSLSDSVEYWTT